MRRPKRLRNCDERCLWGRVQQLGGEGGGCLDEIEFDNGFGFSITVLFTSLSPPFPPLLST